MVGLIVEEQYLPFHSEAFEDADKYVRAREETIIASSYKNGKFGDTHKGVMSGISGFIKSMTNEEGNATIHDIEALLGSGKVIKIFWRSRRVLTIIMSDGVVIHVTIKNLVTQEFSFHVDKSLRQDVNMILKVAYRKGIVIFLFEDNRLMIARTFNKKVTTPEEVDFVQPEVIIDNYPDFLPHLAYRRTDKTISINHRRDLFVVWWPASKEDVFPWTPRPEDRANILVYQLNGDEVPTLLTYLKTDHKLLDASFTPHQNQFSTLEQEVDLEGNIALVDIVYDLDSTTRLSETAIPVHSEITCFTYDLQRTRLAFGCCDSSVVIYSPMGQITLYTKTAFIPVSISWHPNSYLLFVAGERGQYQIFDIALSPMLLVDPFGGEMTPSVTKEFFSCGPISQLLWSPWPSSSCDSNLLIWFRSGPMIVLRFGFGKIGLIELVNYYLDNNEISESIKVLKSIYWSSDDCLMAMYNIFGRLIRRFHSDNVEYELEQLLAVYFVSTYGGDELIRKKHNKSMRILARRFFMWLLRASKFQRALQIAVSLGEPGLFAKLHSICLAVGETGVATSALRLLQPLLTSSSGSSGSGSSFDESSSSNSESADCSCDTSQATSEVELEHEVLVPEVIGDHSPTHGQLRVLPLENEEHNQNKPSTFNFNFQNQKDQNAGKNIPEIQTQISVIREKPKIKPKPNLLQQKPQPRSLKSSSSGYHGAGPSNKAIGDGHRSRPELSKNSNPTLPTQQGPLPQSTTTKSPSAGIQVIHFGVV